MLASILFLEITIKGNINARLPRKSKKRQYEYKRDNRLGNSHNAVFLQISKTNHNFNFNTATMLSHIHNKRLREIFEASAIWL